MIDVTVRLLLAENYELVRRALRALLEAQEDIQVAGETGDGLEAVQLAKELKPDVLVVDLLLPGMDGFEVVRRVKSRYKQPRIIVLSTAADEAFIVQAFREGADGYVMKEASGEELVKAVRSVVAGRPYLGVPASEHTLEEYLEKAKAASEQDPFEGLTPREREVFQMVLDGLRNVDIAARLGISKRTVETHRAHVMHKLGLKNRAELIRFAREHGLFD